MPGESSFAEQRLANHVCRFEIAARSSSSAENLFHQEWRCVRAPVCAGPSLPISIHDLDELSVERDVSALAREFGNPHRHEALYWNGRRACGAVQSTMGTITSCGSPILIWFGSDGANAPTTPVGTPIRFEIAVAVLEEFAFAPV